MEIIAIENMRDLLISELPHYINPVILISTQFYPGCEKCNSAATEYHINIIEKEHMSIEKSRIQIEKHKFPIPVYFETQVVNPKPKKIVIGTSKEQNQWRLVIRKIIF